MLHESQLRWFTLFFLWGTSEPGTAQEPSPNICLVGCQRLSPSCQCQCHHPKNLVYHQCNQHFPAFQPQDLQEKPSLILCSLRSYPVFFLDDRVRHDLTSWSFVVFRGFSWHSWFLLSIYLIFLPPDSEAPEYSPFFAAMGWEMRNSTEYMSHILFYFQGGNQLSRSYWHITVTNIQARSITEAKKK